MLRLLGPVFFIKDRTVIETLEHKDLWNSKKGNYVSIRITNIYRYVNISKLSRASCFMGGAEAAVSDRLML